MNSTTPSTGNGKGTPRTPVEPTSDTTVDHNSQSGFDSSPQLGRKAIGYGMPCAKCRTYYASDLNTCPVCKSAERVSPIVSAVVNISSGETLPDPVALEEERERFLREFKSQVFVSQMPLNAGPNAHCCKDENHQTEPATAIICQGCYDQLQERVDVLEAALHMDLKEAAQIIYDAVWADPSDPNKTYQNAAHALLGELRKRSGVTPTFGPLTPMLD